MFKMTWCQKSFLQRGRHHRLRLPRFLSSLAPIENTTAQQPSGETIRRNELGIQMIPDKLRSVIFGQDNQDNVKSERLNLVKRHLSSHGLWREDVPKSFLSQPEIEIPKMLGTVEEHFQHLGDKYSHKYRQLCDIYCSKLLDLDPPKVWSSSPGWTRYETDGSRTSVEFPNDDFLVLDIEVNVTGNNLPVMATARSMNFWYSWCHPIISDPSLTHKEGLHHLDDHIPIGYSEHERIIVGHNVGYDRSFLREQYDMKVDGTRFMDTMSLHVCVSGLTGYQRALSSSHKVARKKGINDNILHELYKVKGQPNPELWSQFGTLNNLRDVYKFYCKNNNDFVPISKEERDVFVVGSVDDIRNDFQNLMSYCSRDVKATSDVFLKLWPLFILRCPHPVTLAGMLEMSTMFLPVKCQQWLSYIEKSDMKFEELNQEIVSSLASLANQGCSFLENEKYKQDIWLWDLDWKVNNLRYRKSLPSDGIRERLERMENRCDLLDNNQSIQKSVINIIMESCRHLNKIQPKLAGFPLWYTDLCTTNSNSSDWNPGPLKVSTMKRVVPKLMRLTWDGYALHFDDTYGWGFLVPYVVGENEERPPNAFPYDSYIKIVRPIGVNRDPWDSAKDVIMLNEDTVIDLAVNSQEDTEWTTERPEFCGEVEVFGCRFYKLPHKDGAEANVGNPLSRDFIRYIEDGRLAAFDNDIAHSLLKLNKSISYWKMTKKRIKEQMVVKLVDETYGVILPRVVVAGTVTRRAVEPTWLTASNARPDRIGSELKGMIRAPPGWKFVGADVDSQELWIASILGDAAFSGIHGCTGIGWMTLEGNKTSGTDMHSKTASIVNISRSDAKVLNYGRIYGAGRTFAARFLKQSNPSLMEEEALRKARDIYRQTKGLKKDGTWIGGTESFTFNRLEEIARSEEPQTPVLGCRVSRALESRHVKEDFMTSIVNWVVQSSAVDFLHLMLVCMKWLFECYNIDGRFSISIHDEVRFLVREEDAYKTALALQITNLLTRCFVCSRIGMKDLPQSVAFFSSVDVDDVLRKEPDMECVTPSNPRGLSVEYGVKPGESVDIDKLLQILRTQTSLPKHV